MCTIISCDYPKATTNKSDWEIGKTYKYKTHPMPCTCRWSKQWPGQKTMICDECGESCLETIERLCIQCNGERRRKIGYAQAKVDLDSIKAEIVSALKENLTTEKKYIITGKSIADLDAIKAEILERRKNIEQIYETLHPAIRDVNCYGMQVLIAQLNGFLSLLEGEKP